MRIITRYVLKEHIGPLVFALAALTSLLMLQYVARQLGNLVGKGLPWRVIGEFFVLSLPFTVAMTMPMAVLVATLHAFGRMASESEITAFKSTGVRVTTLMAPVLVGAAFLALGMVAFNDQVLPRANHRLRMLTQDMSRAKPTLGLNEQVLNQITNGFYMRIGRLDQESNRMTDVTIYNLTDPQNRTTIYADSGDLSFTPDKKDLQLVLFSGYQQELRGQTSRQLQRSYFTSQIVRVKDVGGEFEQSGSDTWKGDREKSICEMQGEYVVNARDYERVRQMYIEAQRRTLAPGTKTMTVPKPRPATEGVARLYCNALALVFHMPTGLPASGAPVLANNPAPTTVPGNPATPAPPGSAAAGAAGQVVIGQQLPNSTSVGAQPPAAALTPAMQAQLAAAKAAIQSASPPPVAPPAPNAATTQGAGSPANGTPKPPTGAQTTPPTAAATQPAPAVNALVDSAKAQTVPAVPPAKADSLVKAAPNASATNAASAATPPAASPVTSPTVGTPPAGATVSPPLPPGAPAPIPGTTVPNLPPSAPVPALQVEKSPVPRGAAAATQQAAQLAAQRAQAQQQAAQAAAVVPPPSAGVPVPPGTTSAAPPANAGLPASASGQVSMPILNPGGNSAELAAVSSQLAVVRASMDSLAVEVEKKFALSIACIVFVLFGPPIALRFPRGGVGATLGVSLIVFGLYYVCLMAGETLADDGKLPPWVAMWAANVIFTVLGILGLLRIEKTADASRGGGISGWLDDRKAKRALRSMRVPAPSSATV